MLWNNSFFKQKLLLERNLVICGLMMKENLSAIHWGFDCEERSIKIGYVASHMHEKNGIAKRYWRTLAMIKDVLLIDNGFPVNFWAEDMDT